MDAVSLARQALTFIAPASAEPNRQADRDELLSRPVEQARDPAAAGESDRSAIDARREGPYTEAELARIRELRARDREVRAHERAHLAAAGAHAQGGAQYTFATGPDRRRYAVGGEVQIDTAPVPGDAAATLAKAVQIQRAALAPAEPSAQDRRVAAEARAMAAQARTELAAERAAAGRDEAPEAATALDLLA